MLSCVYYSVDLPDGTVELCGEPGGVTLWWHHRVHLAEDWVEALDREASAYRAGTTLLLGGLRPPGVGSIRVRPEPEGWLERAPNSPVWLCALPDATIERHADVTMLASHGARLRELRVTLPPG